ncbi:MAG: tetratricopeptide repeat protein [Fulvivirga sp.]
MAKNFKKKKEVDELIKRFEEHQKNKASHFFELDGFENIIAHYQDMGKYGQALVAANMAEEQYPFSTELLIIKAQILSNMEKFEEALDQLNKAEAYQPNDGEIYLMKGSILSLTGEYDEAIESYQQALVFAEEKRRSIL